MDDGRGTADLLHPDPRGVRKQGAKKEKEAKVQTARTMWVPAVNAPWPSPAAFLEIDLPEPAQTARFRAVLKEARSDATEAEVNLKCV